MNRNILVRFLAAMIGCLPVLAEENLDQLKRELESLKTTVEQLKQTVEQQQQRIRELEREKSAPAAAPAAQPLALEEMKPASLRALPIWHQGQSFLNLSAIGNVVLGSSTEGDVESLLGAHHDPSQRGFSVTGLELTVDGVVDPHFSGLATIAAVLSAEGETEIELEEAYLQTLSLPWNLQLRAGQFFAEFGRHNPLHAHSWSFVDQPLVITRLLGPDGLRNPGARLSWLAPTPWYTEILLGVFNSSGETTFSFRSEESFKIHGGEPVDRGVRAARDLLLLPRISTSFDLSSTQTLLLGASAAIGPNSSASGADTWILGGDLYWKWKPAVAEKGFPFVSWQTEFLYRHYQAGEREKLDSFPVVMLPTETLQDWGLYSQISWGIKPRWVLGLRGDYLRADKSAAFETDLQMDRWRVSPNLTWYPSEFSKIRLQYNYDHREGMGSDHSVWLQFEYLLGAHAAHKF